ncbi:sugar ABC transporter substrate-binding protein [Subtercola boreus]|uniref:Sugar ABC transporter substrate-binding protein n=1 Tax=Subtercola boreus TaxID=120213 RepID=A0A3E0VRV9_9MICO|nr:extracellular solute-binding protein [Subtercola boreus]RFA12616.1 sugar ABC transporter substrate-binding protein [Subtercola boreus]
MTQHRRSHAQRIGLFAAPLAVGALVLSGCSSTSGTSTDGSQSFSLSYAVSTGVESPFETLAKAYMAATPGVTITLNAVPNDSFSQTTSTQFQAGNGSDVIESQPGSGAGQRIITLAKAGFLEPLDDGATALIPSGNESLFQIDGKTYGQALSISFVGNILNQTAATAAGITSFPTDFTGVLADCKTVAASGGKSMFVLAGAAGPNTGATASSIAATRVYAEDPTWNQERTDKKTTFAGTQGWKDTLQAIIDMKDAGCFQSGAEGAGFDAITNGITTGTTLTMFGPSGAAADLAKAGAGNTYTVEAFPPATSSDKAFGLASANYSLSLNAASKNKDAAKKFLDWMAEPAQSKTFADAQGSLPVTGLADLDLSGTNYAPVSEIVKSGSYVAFPNTGWPNSAVYDALGTGVQGLLTGQTTVDSVLASMDAAWDQ